MRQVDEAPKRLHVVAEHFHRASRTSSLTTSSGSGSVAAWSRKTWKPPAENSLRVAPGSVRPWWRPGLFAFIASFGNVALSLMLSVPGTSTLPVVILTYLDNYNDPSVAALSTLVIVGIAAVIVVADRWFGLAKLI
jgi:putative spermidine/putrescine transport system permease protein